MGGKRWWSCPIATQEAADPPSNSFIFATLELSPFWGHKLYNIAIPSIKHN